MKKIYAIEVSNLCNLSCNYCPHQIQERPKGLMSLETFKKSLELVKTLNQDKLTLHNFGEPLLNPRLEEFIKLAKQVVPSVNLSTNGILLTRERAIKLKEAGIDEVYLSAHDIAVAHKAKIACEGLGILHSIRDFFWHDWAGTAPLKKERPLIKPNPCDFLNYEWVAVLWDGRVASCCMDCHGKGIIGHIDDEDILSKSPKVFSLCYNCHHYKAMQGLL